MHTMVEINEALTRKLADLARLELTEEEVRLFTGQLEHVLRYVEQLPRTEAEPFTHPLSLPTAFRDDIARPSPVNPDGTPKILNPAPTIKEGQFKVPPIL